MRPLLDSDLITLWERGVNKTPLRRGLILLSAAFPTVSHDFLGSLSVGELDEKLLAMREATFGSGMNAVTSCPNCGENLDLAFHTDDLRGASGWEGQEELKTNLSLEHRGYCVQFQVPDCWDIESVLEISALDHAVDSRRDLLGRCITEITREGQKLLGKDLPRDIEDLVIRRMSELDPQANTRLDICCPGCQHRWQAAFDILAYFWEEIDAWAVRTLHQVHILASAYAWGEAEILEMSPWRRQCYLEMVTDQGRYV